MIRFFEQILVLFRWVLWRYLSQIFGYCYSKKRNHWISVFLIYVSFKPSTLYLEKNALPSNETGLLSTGRQVNFTCKECLYQFVHKDVAPIYFFLRYEYYKLCHIKCYFLFSPSIPWGRRRTEWRWRWGTLHRWGIRPTTCRSSGGRWGLKNI